MQWSEIRKLHPNKWIIGEAITTHTKDGIKFVDDMLLVESDENFLPVFKKYRKLAKDNTGQPYFFTNTKHIELKFEINIPNKKDVLRSLKYSNENIA